MPASVHPIEAPAPRINQGLVRALVGERMLAAGDAEAATLFAKRRSLHVEEALMQMGSLDEDRLLRFQANFYRTQFVSTAKLSRAPIHENLLKLIPHKLAVKFCVFPVKYDPRHGVLSVLTVAPDDLEVLKNVQFATRVSKVRPLVARPAAIQAAIRVHYEDEVQAFRAIHHVESHAHIATEHDRVRAVAQQQDSHSHRRTAGVPPPSMPSMPVPPSMPNDPPAPSVSPAYPSVGPSEAAPPIAVPLPQSPAPLPEPTPEAPPGFATPAMAPAQPQTPQHPPFSPAVPTTPEPAVLGLPQAASPTFASLPVPTQPPQTATGTFGETAIGLEVLVPDGAGKPRSGGMAIHDYLETLNVMVALLENERGDLRGHSVSVARLSRRFCERLGLQAAEADSIIAASYLHDIGKSSAFHLTPLNVAQYDKHRQMAKKGYLTPVRIFEGVRLPDNVVSILTHLYERFDGQGFPDRLTAKEIPLGARVLGITETYADLVGHEGNAFRKKLSAAEAWEALSACAGKVFDPNLVDVFKLVVLGDDLRAKLLADSRRALLIDPDAEETTVLELRLAEHGFEVTIARNAADAENELVNEFDVVISEVELKPFDGFALLQRVRQQRVAPPFVFLSKHADSDIVQRAFDMGADEFITKPASPDVVALKVNRVLDMGSGVRKRRGGVSGSLTEMALPDVVQVLFHGRKSGRLTITASGKSGEILFSEGQIFAATFGDDTDEQAFYEMLCLADGDFELDPNFVPSERKIKLSPESLLLEGMRRLDESGR